MSGARVLPGPATPEGRYCGARCHYTRSRTCSCWCGGRFHGFTAAHARAQLRAQAGDHVFHWLTWHRWHAATHQLRLPF